MKKIEESKILDLIRSGRDKEVIPLIYKKVLPQLKNYIVQNKGNREDAYDVIHDSMIIFYEQVMKNEFNSKYNIYGFIYKIAIFRWLNKIKKQKNFILTEELPDLKQEEINYEYKPNVNLTDSSILDSLFSPIGEKCIELLSYTIYSDMNMEDIMVRMNFSTVEAVRMQHLRCKQKLIKEIEKNPSLLKKLKGI